MPTAPGLSTGQRLAALTSAMARARQAGVIPSGVTHHSLRRSYITELFNDTRLSPTEIAKATGHSSAATVMRYYRVGHCPSCRRPYGT